jgi:hypothetical protein
MWLPIQGDPRLTCTETAAVLGLCSLKVFTNAAVDAASGGPSGDRGWRKGMLAARKVVSLCITNKLVSEC